MKHGKGEMTPDERASFLLLLREKNLADAQEIKAQGREVEHIYSIVTGRFMRWYFDPMLVQRRALKEYVRRTPGGLSWTLQRLPAEAQKAVALFTAKSQILPPSPWPETAAFLDAAPDLQKEVIRHGREAAKELRLRPSYRRSERLPLLWWVETVDTLTIHYLSRMGGGQLTRVEAAYLCDLDDRTFRSRLAKVRKWDLIGAARKLPVKLPVARN